MQANTKIETKRLALYKHLTQKKQATHDFGNSGMRRQSSRKLDRLSARCRLWAARNLQARRLHTQQRDISNSAVTSFFFFSKKNGQTSTTNKRRGHFGGYEILTVYIQRETNKTKILTGTSNAGHSMGLPRMQIFSSGAHSSYRGWVRRSVPPSRGI